MAIPLIVKLPKPLPTMYLKAPHAGLPINASTFCIILLLLTLVVTVFCHHEGTVFREFFSTKYCKWRIPKIGNVKTVNTRGFPKLSESACRWDPPVQLFSVPGVPYVPTFHALKLEQKPDPVLNQASWEVTEVNGIWFNGHLVCN